MQLAFQHRDIPPPPLRDKNPAIPSAVEQVVLKALAKDPHERFENVQAFATSLEEACKLSHKPPPPIVPPVSPPHKPAKSIKSRTMLIALALLLISGVGLFYLSGIIYRSLEHGDATATTAVGVQFTATAIAMANPIDATMGILKLHEPLTRNSNAKWDETSGVCTFAADGYHVVGSAQTATPQRCLAHNLNTFSDFTFQVQMNLVKGTGGGILFRLTSSLAYYFRISKDGHYALLTCTGTDCSRILVSNVLPYYDPHKQPNTLAVVVRGMHIELFVNNVRIDSVDDSGSLEGQIGVVAETGSKVVFREAKVWTPTPPPLELGKNTLHMFWRGSAEDQHIYWASFDGTAWSPQQRVSDAQTSSNAPALAIFQNRLFMVWKGAEGDPNIYWASFDGTTWSAQQKVPHTQTVNAPALTMFQDRLFMAWRGAEGDPSIYWAEFDGTTWSQPQPVLGVGTSHALVLAVFQNRLFMAWKGIREDTGIYWASFDGARWSSQQHVPGMVGTSSAPALAIFQNSRLFMVWKGIGENSGIYWTSFDGTVWFPLHHVPGVGTNNAPTLAIF